MEKPIPEGLWLAVAMADGPYEVLDITKKYGRLGYGEQSDGELVWTIGGEFKHAVHLSMEVVGEERLKEWDEGIVRMFYSRLEQPIEDTREQLARLINHGMTEAGVIATVGWDGEQLRFGATAPSTIAKLWAQLIRNIRNPRAWKRCDVCGMPFPVKRKGKGRFCSTTCRVRNHKNQKKTPFIQ
ncbi:hypothetical protein A3194_20120 [Candidatus Thiodiazotropha endoloripes]|uniref:hypothetical protein n=1 Tax=Candidatus Thiodiazotropha endoloripes TaxID=1818881 RepID=UPI00083DB301|nr:hypothetical protein [Candidatus Thiodiazotropha endoloripes]ODB94972.1 hypothetical protein A3194_20120 [Candidatus Thiodiazotropha endoloripes]